MVRHSRRARPADAVAIALGAACLIASLGAQGGRFSPRLDLLPHFAPFWLAGALLAAAYGLLLASSRLRMALVGLGAIGALASAALIVPELIRPIRPPAPRDAPRQIKLIQLNAWEHNADVKATVDWIASERPDIILIEDDELPIRRAMEGRGFRYTKGISDVAIFSQVPPIRRPVTISEHDWHVLPTFARATFPVGDGDFTVFAVHLDRPVDSDPKRPLEALATLLDRYERKRLIVAGDFNLTPWSFTLRRLDRRLQLERRDRAIFSWPAQLPLNGRLVPAVPVLPIDHIYAGSAWRTVSLRRGPALGSDHYPLVVTLALAE
jgi:endonuclease/exonuclease/phosphatase (EEP) superfamily protein YafD